VVGAARGGSSDFLDRLMADAMQPALGQPLVVKNEPGASGTFAAEAAAKASPTATRCSSADRRPR
jgi:tripartite-type tricarboxylate transporter receptor subunit TctC